MRQTRVAHSSFNNTWSPITWAFDMEWSIENVPGRINWC